MEDGTCIEDGCDRLIYVVARRLCRKHYSLKWRFGRLDPIPKLSRPDAPPCQAPECDDGAQTKGYCNFHYRKYLRYGDPLAGGPRRLRQRSANCKVPTCIETDLVAREMCSTHYQRWRTTGDPEPPGVRLTARERAQLNEMEHATGIRRCKACETDKPLTDFLPAKTYRNGRHPVCTPCRASLGKGWYEKRKTRDPEDVRRKSREGHLRSKYGMTLAEYESWVERQDGKCAACGKDATQLFVDHDHDTGLVRELLCNGCNCALGHVGDSIQTLLRLVRYAMKHRPLAA